MCDEIPEDEIEEVENTDKCPECKTLTIVRSEDRSYEYCTKCGACIRRCPANAITMENGKEHIPCDKWNKMIGEKHAPRFGCGLCQVKVPCESKNPVRR